MKTIISILLFNFLCHFSFGSETDQYLSWGHDLPDSSDTINLYFNQGIRKTLQKINKHPDKKKSCQMIADQVLLELKGDIASKSSLWVIHNPSISKFPDTKVTDINYWKASIHSHKRKYIVSPLARTININGIYIGTDKIGHITMLGRAYYQHYLKSLAKGNSDQEAIEDAIKYGIWNEHYLLGFYISGVFSFADLEANYQGLRFARDLCVGPKPFLKEENEEWKQAHAMDIKLYIHPDMDESYQDSLYSQHKFLEIKESLQKYCQKINNPSVIKRIQYYQTFSPSLNRSLVNEMILGENFFERKEEQSFENICSLH